ncbi:uncharacterized protein LOC131166685 [Malania oleifera]|uniref:uncharacterized protein LOC131166685 n=1 Tax=Malania oleifera TaxID=397392 RepID=UPI0025ADFB57|nr:uncharacterized protein LOC131166685 [Malania oleifera]
MRTTAGTSSYNAQAQVVTTLRSGKKINIRVGETLNQEKSREKMRAEPENEPCDPPAPSPVANTKIPILPKEKVFTHYILVPYPTALHAPFESRKETTTESIMDTFRQVKVNIPLLDAIKQVPPYAKFLKDLCTQNRKSRVHINKQVKLTKHMSSILVVHLPPKLKDPGAPIISCVIGDYNIDRAFLDLGACVNLFPYSVFEKFNLGELKPIPVTLSITDKLVKRPWGVIENVLVEIKEFYYPVDFIVLDNEPTEPTKDQIPILLGQPFLAMANACIQSRIMDVSFGNI